MALGHLAEAAADFRHVVQLDPRDPLARQKLIACEKERKAILFAKAINFDQVVESALKRIGEIDEIVVPDDYKGPRIVDNMITLEFVEEMLEWLKNQKKLHRKYVLQIMTAAKHIFEVQPPIVDVKISESAKLTVCGDIHGQFYDVLNVFKINGLPGPDNMYLWNGDFVDRGSFSVECILALFAFKWLYPDSVHLSRGNHETNGMNRAYGFEGEVKAKYSELIFEYFAEIFNTIPLGNLIQKKILVIHGGLFSRDDVTLDDLRKIDRFRQPGSAGLMTELLWSDPQHEMGRAPSRRGVGLQFGPDVTKAFLELNNLDMIIRSHEVKDNGYEIMHDGKLVTIFSAPNYCDSVANQGAYIHITHDLKMTYKQFSAVPHPNIAAMAYASTLYGGQSNA